MKKCKAEYFAEKYNPWASYTHTCEKADGHLGMHRDVAHGAWGFEKSRERKPGPAASAERERRPALPDG